MTDVSVVIPVYNTEKYLKACIDSVLLQVGVTVEIFLVDDGSTDSSGIICDEYANAHDNISVFHIANSGQSVAKNLGLQHAQGAYVTFTDSDDRLTPQMLCKMVDAGNRHHADIVCCSYQQVDEQGNVSHLESSNREYVLNHEEALVHLYSKDKIYSQCWTKLYRRKTLADHHVENEPIRYDEDLIFNIRAFKVAKTTVIVDEPLYVYTYRENSVAHGHWRLKKNINRYIDDRIKRIEITQEAVKEESAIVKEWSLVHIIMYYNELLGRVAPFPEYHSDKRIVGAIHFIRKNKTILNRYYGRCGFSKFGKMLIIYLPTWLYMKYRRNKIK